MLATAQRKLGAEERKELRVDQREKAKTAANCTQDKEERLDLQAGPYFAEWHIRGEGKSAKDDPPSPLC